VGVSEGSGSSDVGSLGDGEPVSLGSSLGLSLGVSLGDPLGDLVGLGRLVGRDSDGTCVGRAGTGDVDSEVDPEADSSTALGLAGTVSTTSGVSLPGAELRGWLSVGGVGFFSNGATGETGEIRSTPDVPSTA
jgi:hypothetical protein